MRNLDNFNNYLNRRIIYSFYLIHLANTKINQGQTPALLRDRHSYQSKGPPSVLCFTILFGRPTIKISKLCQKFVNTASLYCSNSVQKNNLVKKKSSRQNFWFFFNFSPRKKSYIRPAIKLSLVSLAFKFPLSSVFLIGQMLINPKFVLTPINSNFKGKPHRAVFGQKSSFENSQQRPFPPQNCVRTRNVYVLGERNFQISWHKTDRQIFSKKLQTHSVKKNLEQSPV